MKKVRDWLKTASKGRSSGSFRSRRLPIAFSGQWQNAENIFWNLQQRGLLRIFTGFPFKTDIGMVDHPYPAKVIFFTTTRMTDYILGFKRIVLSLRSIYSQSEIKVR